MRGQKDREEFIARLSEEREALGLSGPALLDLARKLLRAGATLHRLAELECSSEAADRDRVPCPGIKRPAHCICEHWHSVDSDRGCGCPVGEDGAMHHPVTRIARQEQRTRFVVEGLCREHGLSPIFGGDPRGAVLLVKVPSGRTNDWGGRGVVVA